MKFKTVFIIMLFAASAAIGAMLGVLKIQQQHLSQVAISMPDANAFPQVNENVYEYLETSKNTSFMTVRNISIDSGILKNCYDATWKQFHCESILDYIQPYLTESGCLYGSFNGVCSGDETEEKPEKAFSYGKKKNIVPNCFVEMLHSYGFSQLGCATFHSNDLGETGIMNTKKILDQNNIVPVGIYKDKDDHVDDIISVDGINVALFSYTTKLNHNISARTDCTVDYAEALEDLCKRIKDIHIAQTDIVAVAVDFAHSSRSSREADIIIEQLFDAGADLIIGTNEKSVLPMKIRTTKQKDGVRKYQLAFPSLGNFLTGQSAGSLQNAGMLGEIYFKQDASHTYISNMRFMPTYCVSYPVKNNEQEAGEGVKVFSVSEVDAYIKDHNSMKSKVTKTKDSESSLDNADDYGKHFTKKDFVNIERIYKNTVSYFFSETGKEYYEKQGWFYLKK